VTTSRAVQQNLKVLSRSAQQVVLARRRHVSQPALVPPYR